MPPSVILAQPRNAPFFDAKGRVSIIWQAFFDSISAAGEVINNIVITQSLTEDTSTYASATQELTALLDALALAVPPPASQELTALLDALALTLPSPGPPASAEANATAAAVERESPAGLAEVWTAIAALGARDWSREIAELQALYASLDVSGPALPAYMPYAPAIAAGGGMTLTGVTVNEAAYWQWGNRVELRVDADFTTVAPASGEITVSLPIDAAAASGTLACFVRDGGTAAGGVCSFASTSSLSITRYDGANFAIGAGAGVVLSGFYLI